MKYLSDFNRYEYLVSVINQILHRNNINESITFSDITITNTTVSDLVKKDSKLSDAIINNIWPSIPSASVYHYTSRESAENILSSGFFRLHNIEKRYNEGEILRFCQTHQLDGYLESEENGKPRYQNIIMPNTFYASFTDTNISQQEEEYFWSTFASCDGVRLRFEIYSNSQDFRKIHYEKIAGHPLAVINQLKEKILNDFGLIFTLKGISRVCSFYLPKEYEIEKEFRLLYRYWQGKELKIKGINSSSFIEIPLNKENESGYLLKITEVQARTEINMPSNYVFTRRNNK